MQISKMIKQTTAALALAAIATQPAWADAYSESYNQNYGPGFASPFPGCCSYAQNTIGWYWTPGKSFYVSAVETILVNVLNGVNDDFPLTVTLYTDRPAAGGSALASATFNPGAFYAGDPPWHGNPFAAPVQVTGGTAYFVGFSGWDLSQSNGARGGINYVVQPDYPPTYLPPDVQLLGQAYGGADFAGLVGTATGNTAAPVIKFVGDTLAPVPEPASIALFAIGLASLFAWRRRPAMARA